MDLQDADQLYAITNHDNTKPPHFACKECSHTVAEGEAAAEDEEDEEEPERPHTVAEVKEVLRPGKAQEWSARGLAGLSTDDVLPEFDPAAIPQVKCMTSDQLPPQGDFRAEVEVKGGVPVIISGLSDGWHAMEEGAWDLSALCRRFGGHHSFKVGPNDNVDTCHLCYITLHDYVAYIERGCDGDDSPLYLSDSLFGEIDPTSELLGDYARPACFDEDLMALVGEGLERPPFRYLLVGPPRTGGPMHIDSCATHAWNTVITGEKRWVMLPPCVLAEDTGDNISTALFWYRDFYPQVKQRHELALAAGQTVTLPNGVVLPGIGLTDFIQKPGETVFVPSGWSHCVINIGTGVTAAITHNYISSTNLSAAWRECLEEDPDVAARWRVGIEREMPHLLPLINHGN